MNTTHQQIVRPAITPGPWFSFAPQPQFVLANDTSVPGTKAPVATVYHHGNTEFELEANARAIAALPDVLAALELADKLIRVARQHFPKSIKNSDRFQLENTCAAIRAALLKAGYTFNA